MLNTKAAVIKEVRSQLSRFLLSNRHTIDWLENESKNESEDPIEKLAEKIGYNSTADLLHGEFRDCVKFVGKNIIEATPKLYDTPELQHIISLQKRTVLRDRNRPAAAEERVERAPRVQRPRILYGNENAAGIRRRSIERQVEVVRRPRHVYGDINEVRSRRRLEIDADRHYSGRVIKKKVIIRSQVKPSSRRFRANTFNLDCRKTGAPDLLDRILHLGGQYGYDKPGDRLTSLHLTSSSCPAIAHWRFMLKRISCMTRRFADVTLITDTTPKQLFFDELFKVYHIKNKRGETYFDRTTRKLYSVWTGTIKTRRYRILFLIDC